jgi:4-hydroxybenzoate polyprenyltransferase
MPVTGSGPVFVTVKVVVTTSPTLDRTSRFVSATAEVPVRVSTGASAGGHGGVGVLGAELLEPEESAPLVGVSAAIAAPLTSTTTQLPPRSPHHRGMGRSVGASARALAGACHPMPSVAVTAFATALAVSAGLAPERVLLVGLAVLTGQLSVGWLNDYVDRELDREAERPDKPLALGSVTDAQVRAAFVLAALCCVAGSLALGLLPGVLHLAAVAAAYAYDVRLKRTTLSWLPFAVSFGLLPAVVTTALPGRPFPQPAIIVAGAALGVAAHLANTVKDTEADARTGVRGFPQAIGPRRSLALAAAFVALAGLGVVVATPGSLVAWACAVAALVAAVLAALGGRRTAFGGTVVAAALVVVGVVLSGGAT